jgi:hypothetical protein
MTAYNSRVTTYQGFKIDTFGDANGWCWHVHDRHGTLLHHGIGYATRGAALLAATVWVDFGRDATGPRS